MGPKYGVQKAGCKKQGHCCSKREEARLPLLFLITMTLFFAICFFQVHILGLIFIRVTNRPMFSKQEYWVQIDWATVFLLNAQQLPLLKPSWGFKILRMFFKKWYFVTKIVLTYCEKKIVLVIEKNFWNLRLNISKIGKNNWGLEMYRKR